MKSFKKLALTAAICSAPMAAFALDRSEPMDESLLSGITGQEGITMTIAPSSLSLGIVIEDDDGYTDAMSGKGFVDGSGAYPDLIAGEIPVTWDNNNEVLCGAITPSQCSAYDLSAVDVNGNPAPIIPVEVEAYRVLTTENYDNSATPNVEAGAIFISGLNVDVAPTSFIEAKIDVGYDDSTQEARLIVGLTLPANLKVTPGEIGVIGTDGTGGTLDNFNTTGRLQTSDQSYNKIVTVGEINMGTAPTSLTLVMGDGDNLVTLYGAVDPTIELFTLTDPSTSNAGSLGMASLAISGLVLDGTTVNIHDTDGLKIRLGEGLNNVEIAMTDVYAGDSANSMGDFYITGLNLVGTVIGIKGH